MTYKHTVEDSWTQKVEYWYRLHMGKQEIESITFPSSETGTETVVVMCEGHSRIEQ